MGIDENTVLPYNKNKEPKGIFPPIFAGDMKSHTVVNCDDDEEDWIEYWIFDEEKTESYHFYNAPAPGTIDKVLVGKLSGWIDYLSTLDLEPFMSYETEAEAYPFCTNPPYGYRVNRGCPFVNDPYSDHGPGMVEVRELIE